MGLRSFVRRIIGEPGDGIPVLRTMEGVNYDRGTLEDMADSRRTVEWLETPQGKRAMKEYIAPALARAMRQEHTGEPGTQVRVTRSGRKRVSVDFE